MAIPAVVGAATQAVKGFSSSAPKLYKKIKAQNKNLSNKEIISDFIVDYASKDEKEKKDSLISISDFKEAGKENISFSGFQEKEKEDKEEDKKEKEKVSDVIKKPVKAGRKLPEKLFSIPKFGTISTLLFIILFVLFSVKTINEDGDTRLSLFTKVFFGTLGMTNKALTTEEKVNKEIRKNVEEKGFFEGMLDSIELYGFNDYEVI